MGVRVRKAYAESLRLELLRLGLLDKGHRVVREGGYVYFPVTSAPPPDILAKFGAELVERVFPKGRSFPSLEKILKRVLSPHELALLPASIDIVGDIAIIEVPEELLNRGREIGEAVMQVHRNVRAVYAKGPVSGPYRTRSLVHLAGQRKTLTMHREYNVSFFVDVAKAFFSPRLSWEHHRVANQVGPGELVIDLFTGVGPFAIHIAKRVASLVYAVDLNPYAFELLLRNIKINRVLGGVVPLNIDARRFLRIFPEGLATRVIMDHPSESQAFVGDALRALCIGGKIHYYRFMGGGNPVGDAERELISLGEKAGRKINVLYSRKVKSSAPHEWLVVVDGEVV